MSAIATSGIRDGPPVVLLHGWPYDIHSYVDVAPMLAAKSCRVIVPHLRGHGTTRVLRSRDAQGRSTGRDWCRRHRPDGCAGGAPRRACRVRLGGTRGCVAAALWPERCAGSSRSTATLIQDIAKARCPASPKVEAGLWYQFYFTTERGGWGWLRTVGPRAAHVDAKFPKLELRRRQPSTAARLRSTTRIRRRRDPFLSPSPGARDESVDERVRPRVCGRAVRKRENRRAARMPGLVAWVHSVPSGSAEGGGDVHYVSVCSSCIVSHVALADVSGHGQAVVAVGEKLRELMVRYLPDLEQAGLMRDLNRAVREELDGVHYATMIAAGWHGPRRLLVLTNAGHPPPLRYRAAAEEWSGSTRDVAAGGTGRRSALGLLDDSTITGWRSSPKPATSWCCTRTGSPKPPTRVVKSWAAPG